MTLTTALTTLDTDAGLIGMSNMSRIRNNPSFTQVVHPPPPGVRTLALPMLDMSDKPVHVQCPSSFSTTHQGASARRRTPLSNELDHVESGQSPGDDATSTRSLDWPTERPIASDRELANYEPVSAALPLGAPCLAPHANDIPGVQPGHKLRGGRR